MTLKENGRALLIRSILVAILGVASAALSHAQAVSGWNPTSMVKLSEDGGVLNARLTGGDPWMSTAAPIDVAGPVTVEIRVRIQSAGDMQVFWTTDVAGAFAGARSVFVPVVHDGAWQTVTASVATTDLVKNLRIDFGTATGAADVDWIRVLDAGSTEVMAWEFGGAWDGRPYFTYNPFMGWLASPQVPSHITLNDVDGYLETTTNGLDPYMYTPVFTSLPGPVRVVLRMRSPAANAGFNSDIMWTNSVGGFSIAAGRGMIFNLTHDGLWHEYSLTATTPDIRQLRLDTLNNSTVLGEKIDVDYIQIYDVPASGPDTLLKEWDFGLVDITPVKFSRFIVE